MNLYLSDSEEKIKELDHPTVSVKKVVETVVDLIKQEHKTPTITLEAE